jgi:predicted transposase YbfD/YdcC
LNPSNGKRFPPQHETVDKGHGRIEIRKIRCSTDLKGYIDFPFHGQVVRIDRITTDIKGKHQRCEVAYGITSLSPEKASPQRLLQLNRGHWCIENGLHYVRDVTFQEDLCQIRTKSAPRVMATLRNLVIGILRLNKHKNIAKALRYYARKPHLTLGLIGL